MKLVRQDKVIREMVKDVMKHVRSQKYTPQMLCDVQSIIDAQFFYYWSMDMKKEEYVCDLFTEEFLYRCYAQQKATPHHQALLSKYVNRQMVTMHMSHNPMVWLMDQDHARAIFLYEDHNTYKESKHTSEGFSMYCNDYVRCDDGIWRISALRIAYRKMDGELEEYSMPEGWEPKNWEEWHCGQDI